MVSSDIDKSSITTNVVDAIGISTWLIGGREIVTLNLLRLFGWKPLLASVVVIADEFLFLCVHRNHWKALSQVLFHRCVGCVETGHRDHYAPCPLRSYDCLGDCSRVREESAPSSYG